MSKQNQLERWAQTRQMGRTNFVVRIGVLAWGLPMLIFFSLYFGIKRGWDQIFTMLPIMTMTCIIGGALFGLAMWYMSEAQYSKYKQGTETGE